MRYRTFPDTDLTTSEVGFGVWTLTAGWWGDHSDKEAAALLHKALDLGVTMYDTADTYGNGRGEEILQTAFEKRRHDIVISTKVGYDFYNNTGPRDGQRELPHNWTADFIAFACDQSLKRLGTDYIDLYQVHNPRMDCLESDEVWGALESLKQSGKVRHYGAALGPAIGWRDEGVFVMEHRTIPALQVIHNLLEQEPGRDFIATARRTNTGLMARVPHSSGMLEGKYTIETTFPPEDHRSHRPRSWLVEGLQKIEHLRFLHEGRDQMLAQASLKWLLAEPLMMTVLPNIYNEEQLLEFAAASDKPDLSQEEIDRINALYDAGFYLKASEGEKEAAGAR